MSTLTITTRLATTAALCLPLTGCYGGADGPAPGFGSAAPGITSLDPDIGDDGETTTDAPAEPVDDDAIDAYVRGLGYLAVQEIEPKHQIDCPEADPALCPVDGEEDGLNCNYVHYRETGQFDEFVAFQPNSATLWPGVVLRGADAREGLLTPVSLPRAPMTFSVSLPTLAGDPVGVMDSPTLSAFRSQLQKILQQGVSGKTPAQIAYEMTQVTEESQISLAVGGSVSWPGGSKVSSMFEFSSANKSNKILVNFVQAYYTVDVDVPASPSDFFTDAVAVADLDAYMSSESPPLYVQSVTYGRRALFAIETTNSVEEVKFALDAAYNGLVVDGELEIDAQHREVLDKAKISALVLGGSGAAATKAVGGFEGLVAYIQEGGDFSLESPGAPIAYKLAYLDNTVTRFAFTTEYATRSCYDTAADLTAELVSLEFFGDNEGDAAETLEVYGNIAVSVPVEGGLGTCDDAGNHWLTLFDRSDDTALDIHQVGPWTPPNPIVAEAFDVPIAAGNTLCIKGWLKEKDSGLFQGDDDLGEGAIGPFAWEHGWVGDHVLQVVGGGGEIHATIRVDLK